MNIISLKLIRDNQTHLFDEKAIYGHLKIAYLDEDKNYHFVQFKTIENIDYLFPPGHYYLKNEHSPKFKRNLWEFYDVPGRSEIKFHLGNTSSHSKGCPLLSEKCLYLLDKILNPKNLYTIKVL